MPGNVQRREELKNQLIAQGYLEKNLIGKTVKELRRMLSNTNDAVAVFDDLIEKHPELQIEHPVLVLTKIMMTDPDTKHRMTAAGKLLAVMSKKQETGDKTGTVVNVGVLGEQAKKDGTTPASKTVDAEVKEPEKPNVTIKTFEKEKADGSKEL